MASACARLLPNSPTQASTLGWKLLVHAWASIAVTIALQRRAQALACCLISSLKRGRLGGEFHPLERQRSGYCRYTYLHVTSKAFVAAAGEVYASPPQHWRKRWCSGWRTWMCCREPTLHAAAAIRHSKLPSPAYARRAEGLTLPFGRCLGTSTCVAAASTLSGPPWPSGSPIAYLVDTFNPIAMFEAVRIQTSKESLEFPEIMPLIVPSSFDSRSLSFDPGIMAASSSMSSFALPSLPALVPPLTLAVTDQYIADNSVPVISSSLLRIPFYCCEVSMARFTADSSIQLVFFAGICPEYT
ncbi:hypothetical protein BDR06DRAFT_1015638 [Suillus hirtellus]|nr:hypothetical protein BDR06DRAFT_1015638 [Suillus hirtellus]